MKAEVNGEVVGSDLLSNMAWTFEEMVAYASRGTTVRVGDVLGSGTLAGGCLLELGPQDFGDGRGERWIEPGDVVALQAEGLGTLETPIEG